MRNPVWVWDLPFAPMTLSETVDAVSALVESRRPSFFITANTHYAMLTKKHPDLHAVNARAAFLVADGAPLVWASRWQGTPLPERVAGSDLIFDLCARAAEREYRVFLLGGATGVAEEAARRLCRLYPRLRIVGIESPPFRAPTAEEHAVLVARIRAARPDLLFVAFGQPKGEFWIADHLQALGVPVCVQVGASLDFVVGQVRRAPRPLQRLGLEWAYRMWREPRRLGPRYARNARFLLGMVARDLFRGIGLHISEFASSADSSRARLTRLQDLKGTTIPRVP
jgi:N-acetylglucosaminyldiphosphoundecaprenol N-acetyl-beta-D-mannosaminyltransferase